MAINYYIDIKMMADMKEDSRLIGWLMAVILALAFAIWQIIGCASIIVYDNDSQKEFNAEKNKTTIKDSLP